MNDFAAPPGTSGCSPRNAGPVSLEGMLMVRKGKWTGRSTWSWQRRFVSFRFEQATVAVFKNHPEMETSVVKTVYTRLQRNLSMKDFRLNQHDSSSFNHGTVNGESALDFEITADLPWIIKDIVSDPVSFVLEIDPGPDGNNHNVSLEDLSVATRERLFSEQDLFSVDGQPGNFSVDEDGSSIDGDGEDRFAASDDILEELENARSFGKPLRIYFRCNSDTNEKGLWLKAFASFGRLSRDLRSKKSLLSSLTGGMHLGTSRIRNKANELLAKDARHLDMSIRSEQRDHANAGDETNDVEYLIRRVKKTSDEKEFRVLPSYAYPHRWMTKAEMVEEMILPSDWFHDLRVPGCRDKEIGSLKVEVLQCVGLPRLDRGSDSDAVVYLVCGSYAFSTDIIYSRTNPMWLRKSRRACEFPIFHGYSRLYVGVFDDEPRRTKDDFAGRIVLDMARLRPNCEYDCTFPLRLSSHVYSRRRRGAVRLRFTLNWNSERDALLSYVPKTLRIPLPQHSKPNYDTTVMCSDQKAFRNIAITVHGAHLPGRFTFHQLRAVIREINFTRKYVFSTLLRNIREIRQWQNPAMSAFVFFSWMHCIYANAFSLVPAYAMLFLLLNLMQNYARYGLDGPSQRGFVPPSWEELLMALLRGSDKSYRAIGPIELQANRKRLDSDGYTRDVPYQVKTHEPKGKKLLRALGFMTTNADPDSDHIEFPFADGRLYPKLSVRQCLAYKGSVTDEETAHVSHQKESKEYEQSVTGSQTSLQSSAMSRFNLDVDFLRKDSSGTKDYDAEEIKFGPGRAVMTQGRRAASKISSKTGIDFVVRTTQSGISSGVEHVSSGVKSSVQSIRKARRSSINSQVSMWSHDNNSGTDSIGQKRESAPSRQQSGRAFSEGAIPEESDDEADEALYQRDENGRCDSEELFDEDEAPEDEIENDQTAQSEGKGAGQGAAVLLTEYPDQDIDVTGPSSGKKITDDLAEVRDKMHELTWHLFDDHTYVMKHPKAVFFNDLKKGRIKGQDPTKDMDKYLHMGKYSHSNPFVARVGTYVEPIVSSMYSILCFFRAGFNIITWRDPFLTFLLSFFMLVASIVLFFFPWRIFLFIVGLLVVGPQNWALRVLREQGHLPKTSERKPDNAITGIANELPSDKPLFTTESRKAGNEPRKSTDLRVDPREVHHVVVPYGPLFYQRCNDWPPEPQYCKVVPNVDLPSRPIGFGSNYANTRSMMSSDSQGLARLRRRLLRKRANTASSIQSKKSQGSRLLRSRSSSGESLKTK